MELKEKEATVSFYHYNDNDTTLTVVNSFISCGVYGINGIEEFFNPYYNNNNKSDADVIKDFIYFLKTILKNTKAAFFCISYRSYKVNTEYNKLLKQIFPIYSEPAHNPNSGNEIIVAFNSKSNIEIFINKFESAIKAPQPVLTTV